MIDRIFIPSLGRSHAQITFDNMTPNAQRITKIVVQPFEQKKYSKYPTVVLPDNDIGITATRKWIWLFANNKRYMVMDDDIKMACRKPWHDGEKTKRIMTEDDWHHMLTQTSKWMDEGIAWGGCRTGGLPPAGKEYIDNTGTAEVWFFDGTQLPSADELDWDLSTAEDISLSLQLLSKGYRNRIWDRFVYLSDFVGTEGGCMDMGRNMDMINNNHAKLIKKFPNYVSWNGEKDIRGEKMLAIKVQYKKAYLDSQKSKASLEQFME